MTTPKHDQPDHGGLFPAGKQRISKKLRFQSGYYEYKMKALLIKVGFCDAFVWSLNTNKVCEVAAMAKFNLNKTQSLNDALRLYIWRREGEFRGPCDRGGGVPSFDEMMDIALVEVDFHDPTTNVRGRRALAIAKPTPRGY